MSQILKQSDFERLLDIMIDTDMQHELIEMLYDEDDLDDWAFVRNLFDDYTGKPT
jgi:hypothetical protein